MRRDRPATRWSCGRERLKTGSAYVTDLTVGRARKADNTRKCLMFLERSELAEIGRKRAVARVAVRRRFAA